MIRLAAAVAVAALVAVPSFAQRGHADFTRFVALGDSYGAGVVSGSLNERHQVWSWPAVIARQVGYSLCQPGAAATDDCFAQPLVTFPGLGPELQLINLAPTIAPAAGSGSPAMNTFGRRFNNLSIPGATVGALLTLTGGETPTAGEPTAVSMARFILRGQGTAVQQALAQNPTFIAIWIGGNDALSAVFSGTPASMTSATDFRARYDAMLSALVAGAPNAGMVVGNIPVYPLPYMMLIPPVVINPATNQPVPGPNGQPIPLIAELGDGTVGPLPAGSYVLLHARANLQTGYGLPNVAPFNALPNAGKPLANGDVITPAEFATISARVVDYNKTINELAAARNIPVADINALFGRMYATGGYKIGPITVTAAPVTGGFFGLDFFHLTDLGYMLFANEYIRTINHAYDSEIPVAGIGQLFANNGAFFPETTSGQMVLDASNLFVTDDSVAQIRSMWAQPTIKRMRRVGTH
ncbi:MAG TPA: SGNH/GDSL hydrolase family protein [Thermoanaerobaculia bacterium]|jgi:lysophospholipase L1-like esterase|nr:SGNH/GDSL hydrolase family protein [Thermoanaerobaculia bacterium]